MFCPIEIENGDCLTLMKSLEDNSIDCIITDPPYGINYHNNRRKKDGRIKTENGILNDEKNNLDFLKNVLKECSRVLKDGHHIYWFGRFDSIAKQYDAFEENNFVIKNVLIWEKNNHGTGDLVYSYASKYECIIYAIKKTSKKTKMKPLNEIDGTKRHIDILKYSKVSKKDMIHDHQKPIDLIEFLIKKSTNKKDLILDPFIGSGTTPIAAMNLNREFIGYELDRYIFDNARIRISKSKGDICE